MAERPEARIPCPQCGGAIHPVAGRCKHCKADLAALRVGKPQAAVALPKLAQTPQAVTPTAVQAAYEKPAMRQLDHASAQFSAAPVNPESEHVQILPPRPTGRMFAAAAPAARWPYVVMAISVLAILLSIGALAR